MTVEAIHSNWSQSLPPQTRFSQILIVEDDLAQLRTVTKIMEAEGFRAVGCQLAREALQQVHQSTFGVVIIDLNLPDLPGVKLAEQIHEIDPTIQIIVHTGYGSFETAKILINIGVFALVEKLSDPQELVMHVHRAVHSQISQYAKNLEQVVEERTDQLRQSELWLELAQNSAGIGTWEWNLATQTARCSTTCLHLFGYTTTMEGVTVQDWLRALHPDDYKRAQEEVQQTIENAVAYHSEYRVIWPDGTLHWLANAGKILLDEAGQPTHFIGATRDVTARVEAQQALLRANEELETRVQERTAELRQTNLRLTAEIDERHKTEHALRLANFSLDHAADAILFVAADARIFYANEAACQMHGYTRAELLTMQLHTLNPTLGKWLVEQWQNTKSDSASFYQECHNRRHDGQIFPVELTINDLEFNGTAYCSIIVRDITNRKVTEAQRRQQTLALLSLWKADIFKQGRFLETVREVTRVAAETLSVQRVGLWLFSEDRTKIHCLDLYELSTEQHTDGYEISAIEHPLYFQALEEDRIITAYDAQNDPQTREFRDSYLAPFDIRSMLDAPIRIDEGLVGILCHEHVGSPRAWSTEEQGFASSLADILALAIQTNKRFSLEQKLRESEELRQLAVDGSGIALWDWHVQSGQVLIDERCAAIRGYQLIDIEYHIDFWMNLVHPDDRAEVKVKLNRHLAGETPYYETEYRTRTKSDQWKWILSRGRVIAWDDAGQPIRFLGTQMDITENKHLQQQLLHSQKMEAIGRLAGGIAHDFNNILTVIISYSELILKRSELDARVRLRIDEIKRAGERAALLTRQLLTFSRKQVTTPVVLDLNLVVTEMDQMLRRLVSEDVALQLMLNPDACWIKVDPIQIEQVIMNLVINARDAMPMGGSISIKTSWVRLLPNGLQLHYQPPTQGYVLLAVVDNGTGMDAETQAHIFDPFFTTKEPGKGTGLGLSMVFGTVQQHNGIIEVDSEIGRGSTFHIYLPAVAMTDWPKKNLSLLSDFVQTGEETILLVEDEEQIRALACIALQEAGYSVLTAMNGQDALSLAHQHQGPIHLLLTDVIMPGMSGVQLNEQIMAMYAGIKTLYVSGYANNKLDFPMLHSTEHTAYLPKPFTPDALTQKVREVLDVG